jgi:hypothetical protein
VSWPAGAGGDILAMEQGRKAKMLIQRPWRKNLAEVTEPGNGPGSVLQAGAMWAEAPGVHSGTSNDTGTYFNGSPLLLSVGPGSSISLWI